MLKPAPSPSAAVVGIDERDSGKEMLGSSHRLKATTNLWGEQRREPMEEVKLERLDHLNDRG